MKNNILTINNKNNNTEVDMKYVTQMVGYFEKDGTEYIVDDKFIHAILEESGIEIKFKTLNTLRYSLFKVNICNRIIKIGDAEYRLIKNHLELNPEYTFSVKIIKKQKTKQNDTTSIINETTEKRKYTCKSINDLLEQLLNLAKENIKFSHNVKYDNPNSKISIKCKFITKDLVGFGTVLNNVYKNILKDQKAILKALPLHGVEL